MHPRPMMTRHHRAQKLQVNPQLGQMLPKDVVVSTLGPQAASIKQLHEEPSASTKRSWQSQQVVMHAKGRAGEDIVNETILFLCLHICCGAAQHIHCQQNGQLVHQR